jgi:hypothetical protein
MVIDIWRVYMSQYNSVAALDALYNASPLNWLVFGG